MLSARSGDAFNRIIARLFFETVTARAREHAGTFWLMEFVHNMVRFTITRMTVEPHSTITLRNGLKAYVLAVTSHKWKGASDEFLVRLDNGLSKWINRGQIRLHK